MSSRFFVALCCALLLLAGCRKKPKAPQAAPAPAPGWSETGIASWYGNPYHGRAAASGEIYDMNQMTAAHRTLPFGSVVKVTKLDDGKNVEVRINDRGPFVDGRIIDLSRAAARQLGLIGPGTAMVRIVLVGYGAATPPAGAFFAVQVGSFSKQQRAERLREELGKFYAPVEVVQGEESKPRWRVLVGRKPTEEEARALAGQLRDQTGEKAFVVRMDAKER
jgi:rare lipoprotein A